MSRPTLEVADIIRAAGNSFIERNRDHLAWPQIKVLRAIRDCRTAALGVIWTDVLDADIRPSRITHVETGIVQSARPTLARNGQLNKLKTCFQFRTSTWSSRFRMTFQR